MKYLLFGLAFFVASQSHAQHVYKCVNGKNLSYQSQPCPDTHKAAKQWDATPEPPPSNAELWRRYKADQQRKSDMSAVRQRSYGSSDEQASVVRQQPSQCDQAREHRRRQFDANPSRSYAFTQALDDAVARACK
ncbi:MAG: hypothetical protein ABI858_08095 [Pseudoxanthomonas sp.]